MEHGLHEVAHLLDATDPATVMSSDYGVAPESGFDAIVDDCMEALRPSRCLARPPSRGRVQTVRSTDE